MSATNGISSVGKRHAILGARARRLARPRDNGEQEVTISCLVCEAGPSLYALPLTSLARVTPFQRAAPAPSSNPALLGAIARGGVFYHVFDLTGLLTGGVGKREGGHVAMLRGGAPALALRIDRAERVTDLIELPATATSQMGASHPAIKGYLRPVEAGLFDGRTIALVDVEVLTSDARRGRDEGE